MLKADDVIGIDGVGIGVLKPSHGLFETLELTHPGIGCRHDLVAIDLLAPLGAKHFRLGFPGFCHVALPCIGDSEVGQYLASGEIDKFAGVEAFHHALETFGMVLQLVDTLQRGLTNWHCIGISAVVKINANQLLGDVVISDYALEGVQLAQLGQGALQAFNAFVGATCLRHRLGNESLGSPYVVSKPQGMSQTRCFGGETDDVRMVANGVFDACQ